MKYPLTILLVLHFLTVSSALSSPRSIEVGVSLPLSGGLSGIGTAFANGIEAAKELHQEKFHNIKFKLDDSRYEVLAALSFFELMRVRPEVGLNFIWGSPTCMAVAPIAERERRPLLCFSGDPKPNFNYVFSFNNPATDYATVISRYLASNSKRRWAIVYSDIPFYGSIADSLEQQVNKIGITTLRESILPDFQDFPSLVNRLKSQGVSGVATFLLPSQIPSLARAMNKIAYHPMVIGADTFSDVDMVREGSGVLGDAVYVDMAIDSGFAEKYEKKFRNRSNLSFAYNGYAFALFAAKIFGNAESTPTPEKVLNKLQQYKDDSRVVEQIKFEKSPDFGQYFAFPVELKKVKTRSER